MLVKDDEHKSWPVPLVDGLGFMMFNTTFNNIWAISWRSVSLVDETGVPGEKHKTCRKSL